MKWALLTHDEPAVSPAHIHRYACVHVCLYRKEHIRSLLWLLGFTLRLFILQGTLCLGISMNPIGTMSELPSFVSCENCLSTGLSASVNPSVISQTGSLGSPHPLAGRSGAAGWCRCEQWLQEAIAQRCLELWCAIVPLTVKPRRSVGSILRVHTRLWSDGLPCKILFPIHCYHTLYTHTHRHLTVLQWAYLQETNNLISSILL